MMVNVIVVIVLMLIIMVMLIMLVILLMEDQVMLMAVIMVLGSVQRLGVVWQDKSRHFIAKMLKLRNASGNI